MEADREFDTTKARVRAGTERAIIQKIVSTPNSYTPERDATFRKLATAPRVDSPELTRELNAIDNKQAWLWWQNQINQVGLRKSLFLFQPGGGRIPATQEMIDQGWEGAPASKRITRGQLLSNANDKLDAIYAKQRRSPVVSKLSARGDALAEAQKKLDEIYAKQKAARSKK